MFIFIKINANYVNLYIYIFFFNNIYTFMNISFNKHNST